MSGADCDDEEEIAGLYDANRMDHNANVQVRIQPFSSLFPS